MVRMLLRRCRFALAIATSQGQPGDRSRNAPAQIRPVPPDQGIGQTRPAASAPHEAARRRAGNAARRGPRAAPSGTARSRAPGGAAPRASAAEEAQLQGPGAWPSRPWPDLRPPRRAPRAARGRGPRRRPRPARACRPGTPSARAAPRPGPRWLTRMRPPRSMIAATTTWRGSHQARPSRTSRPPRRRRGRRPPGSRRPPGRARALADPRTASAPQQHARAAGASSPRSAPCGRPDGRDLGRRVPASAAGQPARSGHPPSQRGARAVHHSRPEVHDRLAGLPSRGPGAPGQPPGKRRATTRAALVSRGSTSSPSAKQRIAAAV